MIGYPKVDHLQSTLRPDAISHPAGYFGDGNNHAVNIYV
jgi:hypothetical protein